MTPLFSHQKISHYYGDLVRFMFIIVGIIVLIGMPTYAMLLNIPSWYAIAAIIALGVAAGLTNPLIKNSLILNIVVSVIGLVNFIILSWYMRSQGVDGFMLTLNQVLAIVFLLSLYLSIKSLRGYYYIDREVEP